MPTKPRRGEVVLLPFPFADLTGTKVRPALVLNGSLYNIIVAAITSNVAAHQGPTDYTLQDWRQAGLLARSVVKASLATFTKVSLSFGVAFFIAIVIVFGLSLALRLGVETTE